MCTVTFVPTKNGFIFTSNRDEDPQRAASKLIEEKRGEYTITFPQDEGAKGTWFAFSNRQQFVCVLNGAFEPHIRKSSYSMSRGAMALAFFDHLSLDQFIRDFDFSGIEPFTLLVYNAGDFREIKWDERDVHHKKLSINAVHLWSSPTLYTDQWQVERALAFKAFVADQQPTQNAIVSFHKTQLVFVAEALQARLGSKIPLTNIPLKTTSVSSIEGQRKGFNFIFHRTDGHIKVNKSTF